MIESLKAWDKELFIYLNQLGSENFDSFWIFITRIENWVFLFLFFAFLIFYFFPRKRAVVVALFTIATFVITFGIKILTKLSVERLRPSNSPELLSSIRVLQFPADFSFFSGHASVSMAVTTFLVLCLRKHTQWTYLLFIWPMLFSFSRIYVGVHYPSDIMVGWMVGSAVAFVMYFLLNKLLLKIPVSTFIT